MIILVVRTDQPEAELWLYNDQKQLQHIAWPAHLKLTETLHSQVRKILNPRTKNLKLHNPITDYSAQVLVRGRQVKYTLGDIGGIVCFQGPGSFTGLRIGLSVANTFAYSLDIPIVARRGNNWLKTGITALLVGKNDKTVVPFYDRPAAVTPPKK